MVRRADRILPILHWDQQDIEALAYAIWFHDCYYDPYAPPGVNEARSAQMFDVMVPSSVSAVVKSVARKAILCTANHDQDQDLESLFESISSTGEAVAGILLDLDLASLADPFPRQLQIQADIRAERYMSSEDEVARGQIRFFESLLRRKSIYYTPEFTHLEQAARCNIESLIEMSK